MRRIRPDRPPRQPRGMTLIEMVVAMVVVAIILSATIFFAYPVRQAADATSRAELTDIADNALQRIGRDVRLALPNSVRVTTSGSSTFIEFLAVRAAGRYRADAGGVSSGTDCPVDGGPAAPAADQLSFDVAETCFKTIGTEPSAANIVANSDFLVLNNYGAIVLPSVLFPGQNAYQAAPANRVLITGLVVEATRLRISFGSTVFQRSLHDSSGKRFYVISGPVTYECNTATQQVIRYSGYAITAAQPTAFGVGARIADYVTGCAMDYDPNGVAPQVGVLTLRLVLSRTMSGGAAETVSLYHAVHVSNLP